MSRKATVTLFTRESGSGLHPMGKRVIRRDDGTVEKEVGSMTPNAGQNVKVASVRDILTLQKKYAGGHAYLTAGTFDSDGLKRVVKKDDAGEKDYTRSTDHLAFRNGRAALFVNDFDESWCSLETDEADLLKRLDEAHRLGGAELKSIEVLVSASSGSAYIVDGERIDKGGRHLIWLIKDATDYERYRDDLAVYLTLDGSMYGAVSKSGGFLERGVLDLQATQVAQPLFFAGPDLDGPGLELAMDHKIVGGRRRLLDTRTLRPPTDEQRAQAAAFWAEERRQVAPKMAENKSQSIARHQRRLESSGVNAEQAQRMATALHHHSRRLPYDALMWLDGYDEPVRAHDILLNPAQYDGATGPDVLEPDYGGGRQVSKVYAENGCIFSQAHGGITYKLTWQTSEDLAETPLTKDVMPALEALRQMDDKEVKTQWLDLGEGLAPIARKEFVKSVNDRLGGGVQVLTRELKLHCEESKKQTDALKRAARQVRDEVKASADGKRRVIDHMPEEVHKMSVMVEETLLAQNDAAVFRMGRHLVRLVVEEPAYAQVSENQISPKMVCMEPYKTESIRAAIEAVCVFMKMTDTGKKSIAVPVNVMNTVMNMPDPKAPFTYGVVPHPIVLSDGQIIDQCGYDPMTRLYVQHEGLGDFNPFSRTEAKRQLRRLKELYLHEFCFTSDIDEATAVALLFTCVLRKVMDIGPAFFVSASMQSSGKTTLCRRVHLIAAGTDLSVTTPPTDSEESRKKMLAVLLKSPEMICLDNVIDGMTLQDGPIASIITSGEFEDRVLGGNEIAKVKTRTTITGTGNNVTFGADEVTRWLNIRMDAGTANPHERRFEQPDVPGYALSIRGECLRIVIGIAAGYLRQKKVVMDSLGRFPQWDKMVRQSILWAGGADVGHSTRSMVNQSDSHVGQQGVVTALQALFGDDKFTATELVNELQDIRGKTNRGDDFHLEESLRKLRCGNPYSTGSVGRALKGIVNRPHECGLFLRNSTSGGVSRYWVECLKV